MRYAMLFGIQGFSDPLTMRVLSKLLTRQLVEFIMESEMSKREIIDFILDINRGAKPEFLAQFPVEELTTYLEHLMAIDTQEPALCAV